MGAGAGAGTAPASSLARSLRLVLLVLMLAAGAGCATLPPDATPVQRADPFEAWNRKVFDFNDGLDEAILKPVAKVYAEIFPPIVRRGVDNFYANMADAWSAVNSLLQGQPFIALQSAFRFAVNSTFGILGIIDVAADMNIDRHPEDFGQTLGVWGAEPGPYLVWPLIGSSTVRDSIALPLDYAMSPMNLLNAGATPIAIWSLRLVNTRAGLLDATTLLDQIALDKYSFIRDAYLQRRGSMIRDGEDEPPEDPTKDEDPAAPAARAPADAAPLKAASPATAASPQATSPALPASAPPALPASAPPAAVPADPPASEAAK
jgi:phospholipid-binding lipoprotein MlaA